MNLFIVPSWYPSCSNTSYGVFIKEQIEMMARERPDWKIGVSTWGQGDPMKLIWARDHFRNIRKFNAHGDDKAQTIEHAGFEEYYHPALSWTKKIRHGNLKEIIRCNELNYQAHALANGKPDAIVVQACYPGVFVADYLAEKYNVPIYLHVRLGGFMFEQLLSELGSMKKSFLKAITKPKTVVATSKFHAGELKEWFSDVNVLHNPVDVNFFSPSDVQEDFALAVGRLEEEKGFDLLINALMNVPDLKVRIVGSGSARNKLHDQIRKAGIENRVSFTGEASRDDVRKLMQKCKFLILPSKYETFGNVLLEAMACGKPVVATRCGGPEEIVTSELGYLSAIDLDDLAQKISEMNAQFEQFDASELRKIIETRFSPKVWMDSLELLIKDVL